LYVPCGSCIFCSSYETVIDEMATGQNFRHEK
jgi:hypothetical protein